MTLSEAATITIDKGDILGALLLIVPGIAAWRLIGTFVFSMMVAGIPKVTEWLMGLAIMVPLALTGWGLWEFAHWLTA